MYKIFQLYIRPMRTDVLVERTSWSTLKIAIDVFSDTCARYDAQWEKVGNRANDKSKHALSKFKIPEQVEFWTSDPIINGIETYKFFMINDEDYDPYEVFNDPFSWVIILRKECFEYLDTACKDAHPQYAETVRNWILDYFINYDRLNIFHIFKLSIDEFKKKICNIDIRHLIMSLGLNMDRNHYEIMVMSKVLRNVYCDAYNLKLDQIDSLDIYENIVNFNPKSYQLTIDEFENKYPDFKSEFKFLIDEAANLISYMAIRGASKEELMNIVKYTLILIDSAKEHLDYMRAKKDYEIQNYSDKYIGGD